MFNTHCRVASLNRTQATEYTIIPIKATDTIHQQILRIFVRITKSYC